MKYTTARLSSARAALHAAASPKKAAILHRFFKTGKGEYGEGDQFIGVVVPTQRKIAARFKSLPVADIVRLLHSPIHEERLTALLIMVDHYARGSQAIKRTIYKTYLANASCINNWDLVDLSAPNIVGNHLLNKPGTALKRLARSHNLWERRIAIISTLTFIRHGNFSDTLAISEILLRDRHDLIHKAVGWMLREVGKRDRSVLDAFLTRHAARMPRTTLRYAIEKYPEQERKHLLAVSRNTKNP
jgi:3-methyladenine DNA glycosylase AlkD